VAQIVKKLNPFMKLEVSLPFSQPLGPIMSQLNPYRSLIPYFIDTHQSIDISSSPMSHKWKNIAELTFT